MNKALINYENPDISGPVWRDINVRSNRDPIPHPGDDTQILLHVRAGLIGSIVWALVYNLDTLRADLESADHSGSRATTMKAAEQTFEALYKVSHEAWSSYLKVWGVVTTWNGVGLKACWTKYGHDTPQFRTKK